MSRKLISPAFETGQQRTITPPAFEAGQKKRINPDAGNVFVCDVKSAVETQTVKIKGAQSVGDGAVLVEIPVEITARVMVFNRIGGRMTELGRIIGVLRNDRVFTFQYERMLELMGLTGEVRTRSRTPGIYIEDHDISIPLSRHRTLGRHEARIRDIVDTVREATGFEITHFRRASDGVFDVHITREIRSALSGNFPMEFDFNRHLTFRPGTNPKIDPIFAMRLAAFAYAHNLQIDVSSAFRSFERQAELVLTNPSAAAPGNSWHQYGLAVDSPTLIPYRNNVALMAVYGLHGGGSDFNGHIEPIETIGKNARLDGPAFLSAFTE